RTRAPGAGRVRAADDPVLPRRLRGRDVLGLRRGRGERSGLMPGVSVIVPTYNRAHTLGASLASLFEQADADAQIIGADDGSTDGTSALLGGLRDPRLRVLREPHRGIAGARNAGLSAARGAFIAFHDSDDLALPGRLARALEVLRANPEVHLVIQNGILLPP